MLPTRAFLKKGERARAKASEARAKRTKSTSTSARSLCVYTEKPISMAPD